jgi:hypothetical protein
MYICNSVIGTECYNNQERGVHLNRNVA